MNTNINVEDFNLLCDVAKKEAKAKIDKAMSDLQQSLNNLGFISISRIDLAYLTDDGDYMFDRFIKPKLEAEYRIAPEKFGNPEKIKNNVHNIIATFSSDSVN